jgi:hypothetical protein
MSLQAKEALLITRDKAGRILSEKGIDIELVQRGDLIKVRKCLLTVEFCVIQSFLPCRLCPEPKCQWTVVWWTERVAPMNRSSPANRCPSSRSQVGVYVDACDLSLWI